MSSKFPPGCSPHQHMVDLLTGAPDLLSGAIYEPSCSWHSQPHAVKAPTKCHHLRRSCGQIHLKLLVLNLFTLQWVTISKVKIKPNAKSGIIILIIPFWSWCFHLIWKFLLYWKVGICEIKELLSIYTFPFQKKRKNTFLLLISPTLNLFGILYSLFRVSSTSSLDVQWEKCSWWVFSF